MYVCSICNMFGGNSFAAVLRHIGEAHRFDAGLTIRCGIDHCPQTYMNYESFRSHVYRKHRNALHTVTSPILTAAEASDSLETETEPPEPFVTESVSQEIDLHNSGARFLLKARDQYQIPQSTLNMIISDIKGLWMTSMESLKTKLLEPDIDFNSLEEHFNNSFPLDDLETERKQLKYYKDNFHYLEPTERVLGRCLVERGGQSKEVADCCYDISLLDSLQKLLYMDSVQEQIRNSHGKKNKMLGDYCDGKLFAENELFKEDPSALQIQLYYDELEVCNPLGSKAKKHKLGLLYYTLGNLDPVLRSSLKSIHLLSVAKYEHICAYGIDEMIKPVVDDILKLERVNGVEFDFDGTVVSFRGTVTVFSADNLAAWSIGGYKALMSAFRKCQYCMVTDDIMQQEFSEENLQLRTKDIYDAHCADLGGPLNDHIATTFGVVRNSVLNDLKYFHVTTGLVPDIMHNILEGTLKLCMKHLLNQCIVEDKLFSLELLNSRIRSFHFGPDDPNKPSCLNLKHITGNSDIKQSASQMWCLGRFLPLIIGDKIPSGHQYWDNYLAHLEIMDEVFAPIIHEERTDYVCMLVEDFLKEFKRLYPERPLTPKMHYLVHIATWISWCGPLIRLWCMRYEAKHSFFKHIANVLRNFKNLPKTLAAKHQHFMCYQMLNPQTYLRHYVTYTGVSEVKVGDTSFCTEILMKVPELTDQSTLWRAKSTTFNGTTYKKDYIIVSSITDEEPMFGQILDIYETPASETLFIMRLLSTTYFDHHYHAFAVNPTSTVSVCKHSDFADHHPLHICKTFGSDRTLFVCLKYHII